MNLLRDNFFYCFDKLLPRAAAMLPYDMALNHLIQKSLEAKFPMEVWSRNSTKTGNFVFGNSDLDVTIHLPGNDLGRREFVYIQEMLRECKRLYPFLGETNLYINELALKLFESANYFEYERDPLLVQRLGKKLEASKLDGQVFLLRMLYADRTKLRKCPWLRQRKWRKHLSDILGPEFGGQQPVTMELVLTEFFRRLEVAPDMLEEIREAMGPLIRNEVQEETIFHTEMHRYWRFLFPHRHLWFHGPEAEELLSIRGTELAAICLRQIDWEVWGIMGQLPFLQDLEYGFRQHLERLGEVVEILSPGDNLGKRISHLLIRGELLFNRINKVD